MAANYRTHFTGCWVPRKGAKAETVAQQQFPTRKSKKRTKRQNLPFSFSSSLSKTVTWKRQKQWTQEDHRRKEAWIRLAFTLTSHQFNSSLLMLGEIWWEQKEKISHGRILLPNYGAPTDNLALLNILLGMIMNGNGETERERLKGTQNSAFVNSCRGRKGRKVTAFRRWVLGTDLSIEIIMFWSLKFHTWWNLHPSEAFLVLVSLRPNPYSDFIIWNSFSLFQGVYHRYPKI